MNFWTGLLWIYGMHTVLMAIFLLFKKKLNNAQNNRFLFLAILLLPLAVWIPLPSFEIVQESLFIVQLPEVDTAYFGVNEPTFSFSILYIIPVILLGIHLLYTFIKLLLILRSNAVEKEQGLWVINIPRQQGAKSFFKFLLLSKHLDDSSRSLIFAHEKIHAEQWHSLDRMLMRFARIFFWANPMLYLLGREMMLNHEYLADQGVLEQQVDKSNYMELMLAEALHVRPDMLTHAFSLHHQVKNRINHMYQSQTRSKLYWAWVPVIALALGFAACNQESAQEEFHQSEAPSGATEEETMNAGQVDEMPEMEGGMNALMDFLKTELKYPESMKEEGPDAKVVVEFTVQTDGSISDVHALKSDADDAFKEEAIRAVKSMQGWTAGTKGGKAVAVKMVLPITFTMK